MGEASELVPRPVVTVPGTLPVASRMAELAQHPSPIIVPRHVSSEDALEGLDAGIENRGTLMRDAWCGSIIIYGLPVGIQPCELL